MKNIIKFNSEQKKWICIISCITIIMHIQLNQLNSQLESIISDSSIIKINSTLISKKITSVLNQDKLKKNLESSFKTIKMSLKNNSIEVIIYSSNLMKDWMILKEKIKTLQHHIKSIVININTKQIIIIVEGLK